MDIYKIAASVHQDCGNGYCACGEVLKDCWFTAIYRPYLERCAQASYERLFAQADES